MVAVIVHNSLGDYNTVSPLPYCLVFVVQFYIMQPKPCCYVMIIMMMIIIIRIIIINVDV